MLFRSPRTKSLICRYLWASYYPVLFLLWLCPTPREQQFDSHRLRMLGPRPSARELLGVSRCPFGRLTPIATSRAQKRLLLTHRVTTSCSVMDMWLWSSGATICTHQEAPVGSENLIRPQIVDLQRLAAELSPPVSRALARSDAA